MNGYNNKSNLMIIVIQLKSIMSCDSIKMEPINKHIEIFGLISIFCLNRSEPSLLNLRESEHNLYIKIKFKRFCQDQW